jgi:hypothetical protein
VVERYNGFPAAKIVGSAAPGHASGEAIGDRVGEVCTQIVPNSSALLRIPAHDAVGACPFIATFTRTYSDQGRGLKILCSYPPVVVSWAGPEAVARNCLAISTRLKSGSKCWFRAPDVSGPAASTRADGARESSPWAASVSWSCAEQLPLLRQAASRLYALSFMDRG